MKKFLLTLSLAVFGFLGFSNANTVGNFTSSTDICSYNFTDTPSFECWDDFGYEFSNYYGYLVVDGTPFYFDNGLSCSDKYGDSLYYVSSSPYSFTVCAKDNGFTFASDSELNNIIERSGTFYFSATPITYSSSSDSEESGTLLPSGTGALSGIIENLGTTISEFIPYLVFIGLGLLGAIIGFVAIKWLMNRVRAKVYGTFSGGRRR